MTPIAIGYIVGNYRLLQRRVDSCRRIYMPRNFIISYLVLVGDIKRIELKPVAGQLPRQRNPVLLLQT